MEKTLKALSKAKGLDITNEKLLSVLKSRLDKLMSLADMDQDGQVTRADILTAAEKDPSIISLF